MKRGKRCWEQICFWGWWHRTRTHTHLHLQLNLPEGPLPGHGTGKRPLQAPLSSSLHCSPTCARVGAAPSQCSEWPLTGIGSPLGASGLDQNWAQGIVGLSLTFLLDYPALPCHICLNIRLTATGKPPWFLIDQSSSPAFSSPQPGTAPRQQCHAHSTVAQNACHTQPPPAKTGGPTAGSP